jgi:hypothetical protein
MELQSGTESQQEGREAWAAWALVGAGLLAVLLPMIPVVSWLGWPLRLFGTFIHEAGHALAALVSLGEVEHLVVHADGSGVTWTSGGSRFLIGSAGYLGTTLYGVALMLCVRRAARARWALGLTGAVMLLLTGLYAGHGATWPVFLGALGSLGLGWGAARPSAASWSRALLGAGALGVWVAVAAYLGATGGLLTWILGLGCGLGLLAAARWLGQGAVRFAAGFLGVHVALSAVQDVFTVLHLSAFTGAHSDAVNMARDFGLPPTFWALLWCCVSVVAVGATVIYILWRGGKSALGR